MKIYSYKMSWILFSIFFVLMIVMSNIQDTSSEIVLVSIGLLMIISFFGWALILAFKLADLMGWPKWTAIIMPFIFPIMIMVFLSVVGRIKGH